jgi:hypothetical protein
MNTFLVLTMLVKSESEIINFLKELLNPEGFGHSVTPEVRKEAKRILEIIDNEQNSTVRSAI